MKPIFLLKSRRFHLHELPSWLDYQDEYLCFSTDMSSVPQDTSSFFKGGEICNMLVQEYLLDTGWEGISDSWEVEAAFATRDEAEEFAENTKYRYESGFKVSSCLTIGVLDNILEKQSKEGIPSSPKGVLWAVPLDPLNFHKTFAIDPHEHMTLWYDCSRDEVAEYVGMIFTAPIVGIAQNACIQAATVILPVGIPFKHEIPHITLSHRIGMSPIEATKMLQNTPIGQIDVVATFRIEFFQFDREARQAPDFRHGEG